MDDRGGARSDYRVNTEGNARGCAIISSEMIQLLMLFGVKFTIGIFNSVYVCG